MKPPFSVRVCLSALTMPLLILMTGCSGDGSSTPNPNPGTASYVVYAVQNSGIAGSNPSANVQRYAPGANGVLTAAGSPLNLGAGTASVGITLSSDGKYAVVTEAVSGSGSTTGKYQELSVGSGGDLTGTQFSFGSGDEGLDGVAFSADGLYAYAAIKSGGAGASTVAIQQYTVGTGGALVAIGTPLAFSGNLIAYGIALTPDGKRAYVQETDNSTNSSYIQQYLVGAGGTLTATGSPINLGAGIFSFGLVISPDSKYAYSINTTSMANGNASPVGTIQEYAIGQNGALTAVGAAATAPANNGFTGLAFSPDGTIAYAEVVNVSANTGAIAQYAVGGSGTLTVSGTSVAIATGSLPLGIAVLPIKMSQ